jgi:hypothetical protein
MSAPPPPESRPSGIIALLSRVWNGLITNLVGGLVVLVLAAGAVVVGFFSDKIKEQIVEAVREDIQKNEKSKVLPVLKDHLAGMLESKVGTVSVGSIVLDQTKTSAEMTLLHLPTQKGLLFIKVSSLGENDKLTLVPRVGERRALARGIFSVTHEDLFTAKQNSQQALLADEVPLKPDEKYFTNLETITIKLASKKDVDTPVKPAELQYIDISYPLFNQSDIR